MALRTVQIISALCAAILLCLAFIAAGTGLAAGVLAVLAAMALAWLGWILIRGRLGPRPR